jgi:hypothetical protein
MSDYKAVFQPWYEFAPFERLRIAEPYFVSLALSAALALAFLGVIGIHRAANLQTRFESQVEGRVQGTGDHPSTAKKLELQIAILEQRVDGQSTALVKEVEGVHHSLAREDSLIAAIDARLDEQDAATKARLDQQKADINAQLDQEMVAFDRYRQESGLNARLHHHEQESKPLPVRQRSDNRRSVAPHLGLGLTAETGRGLIVAEVDPGSPAERAGVRQLDLLLEVDRGAVSNPEQMSEALLSLRGRHTVRLTLQRAGKTRHVKLSLG